MVRPQPRSRHSSGHPDRRTQPGDLRSFGSSAAPVVFFPALGASSGLILSVAFRPQNRPTRAAVHAPAHSPIARRVANRSCRSNRPACACPRSGCCHFVGSAGSSRLQTGTTGRAVVESSGLCSVIRLFGMPIAARLLCQQVLSVTCSPLRWHARRCCSRAGPYPNCRFKFAWGPLCAEIPRPVAMSLHRRGAALGHWQPTSVTALGGPSGPRMPARPGRRAGYGVDTSDRRWPSALPTAKPAGREDPRPGPPGFRSPATPAAAPAAAERGL